MKDIPGTKYILRHGSYYKIVRKVNGKHCYYGFARTLIIALMKRDWLVANGWPISPKNPLRHIIKNPSGTYSIVKYFKTGNLVKVWYGTYKSLEDAQSERDKLVSVDWDIDAWCDLG